MKSEKWLPIPLAPKYEINQRGDVRNIETKRIIKPQTRKGHGNDKQIGLYVGEKCKRKNFALASLLWLVHGIISEHSARAQFVPVTVSRGDEKYFFDTCRQAAQFLAKRESYSVSAVGYHLYKRREEIYGWRIKYQR